MAVCLDALRQLLPHHDPLVVSTFFLRRGVPGPVEFHTDVARKGHRVSTSEARIVQNGDEIVRTTASFADLGSSPNVDAVVLSHYESIDLLQDRAGGVRFPAMPGWQTGQPTEDPSAEFWIRFTDGREPDTLSLPLLVDGAAPVVLELGVAGSAALELTTTSAKPSPRLARLPGPHPPHHRRLPTKRTSNSGTPTATWSPKPANSPACSNNRLRSQGADRLSRRATPYR